VFARGLMPMATPMATPATLPDTEFLRTRAVELGGRPAALSRRALRGLAEVAFCWWSFWACRSNRSRRANDRAHCWHSNGFSLVCERSCRFRCSRRANARWHSWQTCGRGLSVFGGGKDGTGFAVSAGAVVHVSSGDASPIRHEATARKRGGLTESLVGGEM
jgi:hypothetical protein